MSNLANPSHHREDDEWSSKSNNKDFRRPFEAEKTRAKETDGHSENHARDCNEYESPDTLRNVTRKLKTVTGT